jgi:hypothetical protein
MREGRKLRVFENRVWTRIIGPKRYEVIGEWRKIYNMDHNNLYTTPDIVRVIESRRMSWARHVTRMGKWKGVYRILLGRPEGNRPQGRPLGNSLMGRPSNRCNYIL